MTTRTLEEGRLFPAESWDHGWALSLQADKSGYRCSPAERLATLEEYDSVEAVITGPFPHSVDPRTMDIPEEVLAKFTPLAGSCVSMGLFMTRDDIEAVRTAIVRASLQPNAGIPRGRIGWSCASVFHGTSAAEAADIAANGIVVAKSTGGYFGHAFYVADKRDLAASNYADFSDDEGAVLEYCIADEAFILDMRNAEDAVYWRDSGLERMVGDPALPIRARELGVAGIYDRSFGGIAVFDPKVLGTVVRVHEPEVASPRIGF